MRQDNKQYKFLAFVRYIILKKKIIYIYIILIEVKHEIPEGTFSLWRNKKIFPPRPESNRTTGNCIYSHSNTFLMQVLLLIKCFGIGDTDCSVG